MKRTCLKSATALALLAVSIQSYSTPNSRTLFGLASAKHFQSNSAGDFYIQLGSFKNKSNALKLLRATRLKTHYPASIRQTQGVYIVTVGPMPSAKEVRAVSRDVSFASHVSYTTIKEAPLMPVHEPQTKIIPAEALAVDKDFIPTQNNWYLSIGAGVQTTDIDDSLTVANGSGFPAPYNVDSLSTKSKSSALLDVNGGYRWQRDNRWLPTYSLGLRYKHLFSTDVGNQVVQNSIPEFTNYNYQWKISSDALLVATKLDLFQCAQFSPYINGGIGVAFNHSSGYSETALSGVTPRINPRFSNHDKTAFTYSLGAGVDWQLYPQFVVSLGYEFQDLGRVSSGKGTGSWSQNALYSGSFQSNAAVLSVSYLIGN